WLEASSENDLPTWDFYVNDLSDRYSILQGAIGAGYNGEYYSIKHEALTGITQSVEIANSPENLVFHQEKFQPSVLGEQSGVLSPAHSTSYLLEHPSGNNFPLVTWIVFNLDYVLNVNQGVSV